MNRGYYFNSTLVKFADVSELCSLCGQSRESISHIVWWCDSVQPVIIQLKEFGIEYVDLGGSRLVTGKFYIFQFLKQPHCYYNMVI